MVTEQHTTPRRRRLWTRMVVVLASVGLLVAPGLARAGADNGSPACSTGSLRGTYGGAGTGAFIGVPLGLIATVVFDGAGKVSGHGTAVLDRPAVVEHFDLQQGTYTISDDCTGTARFFVHHRTVSPIDHYHTADLVVSDGGKQVSLIYVNTEFPNAPPAPAESVTYSGHRM